MKKRKQPKPARDELVAVIYRDSAGKLKILGREQPALMELTEVRPPNRKRKSA